MGLWRLESPRVWAGSWGVARSWGPELVGEVLSVIRKLGAEHDLTMLMVTHDKELIPRFSRHVEIVDGKLVNEGKRK